MLCVFRCATQVVIAQATFMWLIWTREFNSRLTMDMDLDEMFIEHVQLHGLDMYVHVPVVVEMKCNVF